MFRADIRPIGDGVDPTVWVVNGDLPTAHIAFNEGDTWQDALAGYVGEMQARVDAVRNGESLDDLIPVHVAPTREHADMLGSRLAFLRECIIQIDADTLDGDV